MSIQDDPVEYNGSYIDSDYKVFKNTATEFFNYNN